MWRWVDIPREREREWAQILIQLVSRFNAKNIESCQNSLNCAMLKSWLLTVLQRIRRVICFRDAEPRTCSKYAMSRRMRLRRVYILKFWKQKNLRKCWRKLRGMWNNKLMHIQLSDWWYTLYIIYEYILKRERQSEKEGAYKKIILKCEFSICHL